MANEINGKEEVIQKTLKVPRRVAEAIQRALEAGIAKGLMPSEADILRQAVVLGLSALGFPVEQD